MVLPRLLASSKFPGITARILGLNNANLNPINLTFSQSLRLGNAQYVEDDKGAEITDKPLKKNKKPRKTRSTKKITEEIDNTKFKGSNVMKPFPNNTNPKTGEVGGPRGPEPTRFGDWERKGRVTDF